MIWMSAVFSAEALTGGAYLILHLRTFEGNTDHAYDDEKIHSLREGLGKCMKEPFFLTSRISQVLGLKLTVPRPLAKVIVSKVNIS